VTGILIMGRINKDNKRLEKVGEGWRRLETHQIGIL
jgi:hypothetical protein